MALRRWRTIVALVAAVLSVAAFADDVPDLSKTPSAEDQFKREIEDRREAQRLGALRGVQMLCGPGCAAVRAPDTQGRLAK